MKKDILQNIDNPKKLESLFRLNKIAFTRAFHSLYPQLSEKKLANFWYERLNYKSPGLSWGNRKELMVVIVLGLIAGVLAKIPDIVGIEEEFFYLRNVAFLVFPTLTVYFAWKNQLSIKKILGLVLVTLVALVYINVLPDDDKSDTLILACIHLPLIIWSTTGFAFAKVAGDYEKRLDYLNYNGDLVVMGTIILISGGLMTGITIGLFSLIGFDIEEFYFRYIAIMGVAAAPLVGTYVIRANPQLVSKVSPVIAKIFSPLVLLTLIIYLVAIIVSGKDPYNDREFLLIFNALLIGVMAIILFSVVESSRSSGNQTELIILFMLAVTTVVVNLIALSAILFRISEWGITPNRLAVLGSNLLILSNLLLVAFRLWETIRKKSEVERVGRAIAGFLPIYIVWAAIVAFAFPLIFNFQ